MNSLLRVIVVLVLGAGLGCMSPARTSDGGTQSSSGAATSTGGDTSSGATSSGTNIASGSSTGGSSSSGGSSTGGGTTGSGFFDGGYVFCSLPNAADAGPSGTPGKAVWLCHPGTYFCDLGGDIGNCFQCRSDADCSNQALPTYDPNRLRCDLDSGVPGYQNFCQQCTANADCAASLVGSFCELSTVDPPSALEPNIELEGFETCYPAVTDCRQVGGPICRELNQTCNPSNGHCENLPATCAIDQDCAGIFRVTSQSPLKQTGSSYLPQPFCVNGACNPCGGGACPNNDACRSDADCGNPDSSPLGPGCDLATSTCVCTSSAQCSGFWPACVGLDAGNVNGSGQAIGVCSCQSDAQCGDGGLICLPPTFLDTYPYAMSISIQNIFGAQAGSSFCGVPCSSPDFPSCSSLTGGLDVCDIQNGLCTYCYGDEQCRTSFGSSGPYCDAQYIEQTILPPGTCGCILDADCPDGQNCAASGGFLGTCTPSLPYCTPASCDGYFCNWDSGACVNQSDATTFASCLSDFDCGGQTDFCFQGQCVQCRDDADCINSGHTEQTYCCQSTLDCVNQGVVAHTCVAACQSDQDCVGNSLGPSCLDGGICGCGSDDDCAGNPSGQHCDTAGSCSSLCSNNVDCPTGFFCDPTGVCRPRCNGGNTCEAPDAVCDSQNVAGRNGQSSNGDAGDAVWCYQCLQSSDCDGGLGCSNQICQACSQPADCGGGTLCLADGLCHATCDAGGCQGGGVCDILDQAGNGPDLCYRCVSPVDCSDSQGCNHLSHTCGTCEGPNANGGPYDCPPDAICSNYWSQRQSGVCLANCDRVSCPADRPICAVFPALTPEHRYCFGCLGDADCGDGGAWCDLSIHRTFTCQPGPN